MQQQPSVIQTGDFLYFAPGGTAYTIPVAGNVSANAKPGAADPAWVTFALGTVKKPTAAKVTAKKAPAKKAAKSVATVTKKTTRKKA